MDIAKPPGGFIIGEPDGVRSSITAHKQQWPRIQQYWDDIMSRLQQTGHREGVRVHRVGTAKRTKIAGRLL
jgi:hypothetical protein